MPSLVDSNVAIAVFIIIIVIAIMAAIIMDPMHFDKSRLRTFLVTAASLGIVITFMWYFFLLEQNVTTQKNIDNNEKRHIEQSIVEASVNDIQKNMDIIPVFCASLFPLQDIPISKTINRKIQITKKKLHETTLSYKLFDTWDHFVCSTVQPDGDICYFLQWASSKELKKQWDKQYINFSKKTQRFGDKLFKTASSIKDKTATAYMNAATMI